MSRATVTQCPECGTVLTESSAIGRIREITDSERAFGETTIRGFSRRDLMIATLKHVWYHFSVLVVLAGVPALIYAMVQMGHYNKSFVRQFLHAAAWCYSGLLLIYAGILVRTFINASRRVRRLGHIRDADLEAGIVEEWWMEATHLLTLDGGTPIRHYLRCVDGRVVGVRDDASSWIVPEMGGQLRLAVLPQSRIAVGMWAEGPPLISVLRSSNDGIVPRGSDVIWCTPIAHFENESQALRGPSPFAGSRSLPSVVPVDQQSGAEH